MGYTKIVQFGNVVEVYEYENPIKPKPPSRLKAERLAHGTGPVSRTVSVKKARQKRRLAQKKSKGAYRRSKASISRSRQAFYRLCHENVCKATTVHFLTLTFAYDLDFKTASRNVARFLERVAKTLPEFPFSYISVPELTKQGRFHFHLLVFNLSSKLAGEPTGSYTRNGGEITTERKTRNLQVFFERGYVDIVLATRTSEAIAGYMAKYMGKALRDERYATGRGYTSSRNISKIRSAGSNSHAHYVDLIVSGLDIDRVAGYDIPYLGRCSYTKYVKKIL